MRSSRGRMSRGCCFPQPITTIITQSRRHVHFGQRGRHVGQRVAAVLADSAGAAEEGCRRLEVDYEVLPAVFDAEEAMRVGAPSSTTKARSPVFSVRGGISCSELHGGVGDVEAGFAQADVIHEATYSTPRAQHAHLETHCTISWIDHDQSSERPHQHADPVPYQGKAVLSLQPLSG